MKHLLKSEVKVLETTEGKKGICAYMSINGGEPQYYTTPVFLDYFGQDLKTFLNN